jgi:mRNA interferase RelE/StbE
MPYLIAYTPTARKQIKDLDRSTLERIMRKIGLLADVPRPAGCSKLSGHASLWRIRVGDYRIVYDVDDERQRIEVTVVAHRRESYRGL